MVEIKAPDITITDEDRRQGLSYARLLEPMAPLVMITNGRETVLLDALTGEPITSKQKNYAGKSHLAVTPADELLLRSDALRTFVGLSYDNLLAFCYAANSTVLGKFRPQPNDPLPLQLNKKYLPAAYISRRGIEDRFRSFVAEHKWKVFPITGDSGMGKTNTV